MGSGSSESLWNAMLGKCSIQPGGRLVFGRPHTWNRRPDEGKQTTKHVTVIVAYCMGCAPRVSSWSIETCVRHKKIHRNLPQNRSCGIRPWVGSVPFIYFINNTFYSMYLIPLLSWRVVAFLDFSQQLSPYLCFFASSTQLLFMSCM
jgi:hypothetical protein